MNYRHAFHAGNFADVFKHALLAMALERLNAKDKPYVYIETHAGAGRYDLKSEAARKTGEWRDGIGRVFAPGHAPPALERYLDCVRAANRGAAELSSYPGSPLIAQHLLRPGDRMVVCELQQDDAHRLYGELRDDGRVEVRRQDGYTALRSLVPPAERRGLVLIDPPYEDAQEFRAAEQALRDACRRWATGVYLLWYPIKDRAPIRRLHQNLESSGIRRILVTELGLFPEDQSHRLSGCGMVLVNPPWPLEEEWARTLPALARALAPAPGADPRTHAAWLVPE